MLQHHIPDTLSLLGLVYFLLVHIYLSPNNTPYKGHQFHTDTPELASPIRSDIGTERKIE